MRTLLPLVLLLLACEPVQPPPTAQLAAGLSTLDFQEVWPGRTLELPLHVLNTHAEPRHLRVELDGDLFHAPAELDVPAQGYATLPVRFTPREAGPASGTLRLVTRNEAAADGEEETLEVVLRGVGRVAPSCPTSTPCRVGRFDMEREACVEEPSPEGSACVQGACEGTCRAQRCAPTDGLLPVWTYQPAPTRRLNFPGLGDAQGNTYWLEGDPNYVYRACELVSVDRAGTLRFRQPLGDWWSCDEPRSLLLAGGGEHLVLWGAGTFGSLPSSTQDAPQWRRRSDGALQWQPDMRPALAAVLGVPATGIVPARLGGVVAGPSGLVYALVEAESGGRRYGVLTAFDFPRREVRALAKLAQPSAAWLLADREENLYFVEQPSSFDPALRSYAPDGTPRWTQPTWEVPQQVAEGWLWMLQPGTGRDPATGLPLPVAPGQAIVSDPVGDATHVVGSMRAGTCTQSACPQVLVGFDPRGGGVRWSLPVPDGEQPRPLLTTRQSVLLSTVAPRAGYGGAAGAALPNPGGVVEISLEGQVLQRRPLCEGPLPREAWALHQGRLVGFAEVGEGRERSLQEVRAYDLGTPLEPATRGWTGERGGPWRAGSSN